LTGSGSRTYVASDMDIIRSLSVGRCWPRVLSTSRDESVTLIDLQSKRILTKIDDHKSTVVKAFYLPAKKGIVSFDVSGEVHVHEVAEKRPK